ncbi:protein TUNICAMYCIN INDUCED 1 [Cornus florida]|uniref:protein TUNICAMYCIN INDUCED 1 n=1 Tax=Cornus florida TaxID=4283 RepID=UPI00289F1FC8|nr:protein TUNICAMYCIN INDUCED 1 [Cornus florida]
MIIRFTFSLLLLIYLQTLTLILAITSSSLNISHYLYPKISDEFRPQPSTFLEDVLKAISVKYKWNLEDIRVSSKLDVRNAKFGSSQRYEFLFRISKSELVFRFRDDVSLWKKLKKGGDFESLVKEVGSVAVLNTIRIEGPFELQVGGDDEISLQLPPLNTSHTGLKRILVGEGITIEVRRAQEVSLLHASELGSRMNRSGVINRERIEFWSIRRSLCMPLLPIRISGSASVVAYKTRNPDAWIETALLSRNTIKLLPEKCYTRHYYKKRGRPIDSLALRISMVEMSLRRFLVDKIHQKAVSGFVKAKTKASNVVRFKLELERGMGSNDTLNDWRTRPTFERVWFEVLARIEAERLKPLEIKKVIPFVGADSSAWSNLMSNISFTKFPSLLVPPEALTLDVKW